MEELLTGTDGEHRAAALRITGEGRAAKRLLRPVQRLYPLEMAVSSEEDKTVESSEEDNAVGSAAAGTEHNTNQEPPLRRSRRAAAQAATDRILAQALASEESDS